MDKFWQALAALLPTGFAWPRDPNSTLMRVLRGIAANLNELHLFIRLTTFEFFPHKTITRLAEWEEACGLPDACFGVTQTDALRRKLLLLQLRGLLLTYADSSPASSGAITQLCAEFGYAATVKYYTPFRVGKRVGQRLGALNGLLTLRIAGLVRTPFRVGQNRVGQRIAAWNMPIGQLDCYLNRVAPARFSVLFLEG
jgi:uncharacterized protein YmfQ (DUF2313 family)